MIGRITYWLKNQIHQKRDTGVFVQLVNSMTDVGKKVDVLIRGAIEWQKREKRKKLNPKMVYLKQ